MASWAPPAHFCHFIQRKKRWTWVRWWRDIDRRAAFKCRPPSSASDFSAAPCGVHYYFWVVARHFQLCHQSPPFQQNTLNEDCLNLQRERSHIVKVPLARSLSSGDFGRQNWICFQCRRFYCAPEHSRQADSLVDEQTRSNARPHMVKQRLHSQEGFIIKYGVERLDTVFFVFYDN